MPGRTVLGIVLDANDNPSARWQALTDRLNRLRQEDHFDLPELPSINLSQAGRSSKAGSASASG